MDLVVIFSSSVGVWKVKNELWTPVVIFVLNQNGFLQTANGYRSYVCALVRVEVLCFELHNFLFTSLTVILCIAYMNVEVEIHLVYIITVGLVSLSSCGPDGGGRDVMNEHNVRMSSAQVQTVLVTILFSVFSLQIAKWWQWTGWTVAHIKRMKQWQRWSAVHMCCTAWCQHKAWFMLETRMFLKGQL